MAIQEINVNIAMLHATDVKKGHISSVFKKLYFVSATGSTTSMPTASTTNEPSELYAMGHVEYIDKCIHVPLTIEEHDDHIPLATGCALSLDPRKFYNDHLQHLQSRPTKVQEYYKKVTPIAHTNRIYSPVW